MVLMSVFLESGSGDCISTNVCFSFQIVYTFIKSDPNLSEFNAEIQKLQEQQETIDQIVPVINVGPLELYTEKLKLGLNIEFKAWLTLYCKQLNNLYRDKMDEIFEFTDKQVNL